MRGTGLCYLGEVKVAKLYIINQIRESDLSFNVCSWWKCWQVELYDVSEFYYFFWVRSFSMDDNDDSSISARNGALYVEYLDPRQVQVNVCVICGKEGVKLSKCRDVKSWNTLCEVAEVTARTGILSLSSGKDDFPKTNVMYHRDCRSDFTHKREVKQASNNSSPQECATSQSQRAKRDRTSTSSIFCRKDKFKSGAHTRETLTDCSEFIADTVINDCALKHIRSALVVHLMRIKS